MHTARFMPKGRGRDSEAIGKSPLRATSRLSPLKSPYLLRARVSRACLTGEEKRPLSLKLEPAYADSVTRRGCPDASLS